MKVLLWGDIQERWLPVLGFPPYEVSDLGRVKNSCTGKILKGYKKKTGYVRVSLSINGWVRIVYVHQLVLLAFSPPESDGLEANHKNSVRGDNRLSNLEWVTRAENNQIGRASCRERV